MIKKKIALYNRGHTNSQMTRSMRIGLETGTGNNRRELMIPKNSRRYKFLHDTTQAWSTTTYTRHTSKKS